MNGEKNTDFGQQIQLNADGTLGISEADTFTAPPGMTVDLSCSGGDSDARDTAEQRETEAYFD